MREQCGDVKESDAGKRLREQREALVDVYKRQGMITLDTGSRYRRNQNMVFSVKNTEMHAL